MGPLAGLRIVEFDAIGPVPLCASMLADMGADVVRIIRAGGQAAYEDVGGAILNRGRTAIELDLKSQADREIALDLIAKAEITIEGFRPGVMERLGIGPEACLERNPKLVYGRMTGYGQSGPLAPRAGHDINYIAITGALAAMGEKDRPPLPPLNLVGDYGAGAMMLAVGLLAALTEARRSGKGQVVDTAMTDGVPLLMSLFSALTQNGGWSEDREANLLDGGAPFYRCYECADGKYVAVGALEPQFFALLLKGLGIDPASYRQNDRSEWQRMKDEFTTIFRTRSRDDWDQIFAGSDACVSPVLTMSEATTHPHATARDGYIRIGDVMHPAPAPRFGRTPSEIGDATSTLAIHVLQRWS
ncbi:CaiB/BaiF CoA transferase family protein [Allorhizobium pseudoryzae]|uniref:CaiB/BaiF CoA transferase family protein n=1 Tax=Allorhizobium pseudoryzae TaxID=379684 RepID=UPI003D0180B2